MSDKIEAYLNKHVKWKDELTTLREIFLSTKLEETVKWGAPVYTINGKNVAGIGAFKNHFGVWFFNGVFLKDDANLLVAAQDTTKAMRQIKFEKGDAIPIDALKAYLIEAADNELKGMKVKPSKPGDYELAEELNDQFRTSAKLKDAFFALSPGKQKEYSNYIAEAKQLKTKLSRIGKISPMILAGKGLHDKYRDC